MTTVGLPPVEASIAAFLSAVERGEPWRPVLREAIAGLPGTDVAALLRILEANRLLRVAAEGVEAREDSSLRPLRAEVRAKAEDLRRALEQRDAVLAAGAEAFAAAGIPYAVFKTLNGFDAPGVDVDVIVDPSQFARAIDVLASRGFRLIDAPEKGYATGLVLGRNPIVLDLHGDLAILGVRYAPPRLLLEGAQETTYRSAALPREVELRAAPPAGDALVRMAHGIIKEGAVTLLDIAEVLRLAADSKDEVRAAARRAGLDVVVASFARISAGAVRSPTLASWMEIPEDGLSSLALGALPPAGSARGFPQRVGLAVSLAALAYRLRATDGLGRAAVALAALRFKRNVEQVRSKVLHRPPGG